MSIITVPTIDPVLLFNVFCEAADGSSESPYFEYIKVGEIRTKVEAMNLSDPESAIINHRLILVEKLVDILVRYPDLTESTKAGISVGKRAVSVRFEVFDVAANAMMSIDQKTGRLIVNPDVIETSLILSIGDTSKTVGSV